MMIQRSFLKEGKGVFKDIPQNGFLLFFFLLYNNFWKLVFANLLFVLFSIPILTIPAATAGLMRIMVKLTNTGQVFVFRDFVDEFKENFWHSFINGLILLFIIALAVFLMIVGRTLFVELLPSIILSVLSIVLLCLIIMTGEYLFLLNSGVELSFRHAWRNSVLLMLATLPRSIALLAGEVLLISITLLTLPYSAIFFLLIGFSVIWLAGCLVLRKPIRQYITDPFTIKNT